jgi:hypothetical protein
VDLERFPPGREINDTTRLIVTVVLTALLVALIVYGLGIVGEESVSVLVDGL